MEFYNRSKELKYLFSINRLAGKRTQLTVLTGRRVGKTELVKYFLDKQRNNFFGIFTVGKINSKIKDKLSKIKVQVWEME